ncbi:DNA recombination protein RmuC [Pseudomonas shahriarae]|uniref:DNA recombination protein RmuC n=1 Tax=Pseudomonas shahriarae TaxID=2745512 RepID=UPI002499E8E2|nr:DNA recombination protein RmuC [Pseudomonas shahriarae]MDI3202951.1 DNA recombination protein RmuC [Pseudomonas shahriarae]
MPASQWTPDIIAICVIAMIASATIAYLLAGLRQGRNVTELSARFKQSQQALEKVTSEQLETQAQLKGAELLNHQQQVAESRVQEQLSSAKATADRLSAELIGRTADLDALAQKLEQAIQQRHMAEKLNENAQVDIRALKEQVSELRDRLGQAESAVQEERKAVSDLKEELAQEGKKAKTFEAGEKEAREQLQERKSALGAAAEKHDALQERLTQLHSQYTKLNTELDERDASHVREVASFEQQKASLAEQFKLLSNEILEAKAKSLQESSKLTLSSVMSPFQQSIDSFKKEVQEIHHRETTQQGELRKELESLKVLNQQITTEAHELSTALRGQKKLQGNWGELILENVLDRSGLVLGKDYQREVSFKTEEGNQRPDAIVYLPQGKHLIIDAKVSLNAYTRYVNALDEAERALALKEHVHAVGSRIKELADRNYYKLPGLKSPDMVFMFIPIESAFVEALKADEALFQQAIENHVLVATPTTLLTSLNIVRQLWRYEDQNKHTAALANKAEAVFNKLNTFLGSFERIKKGLDTATEAYTKAEGQLVSGKGNLVKQVGEFKNLAPAIKAELPSYFADKAALEIDFIPVDPAQGADSSGTESEDALIETITELEVENI